MANNPEDPDIDYIEEDDDVKSDDDETIEVDTSSEKSLEDEEDDDEINDDDDIQENVSDVEDEDEDEENIDEDEEDVYNDNININNSILQEDYNSDDSDDDDDYKNDFINLKNNASFTHPLMNKSNLYNMMQKCEIIYTYDDKCECDIIKDKNHMTNPMLSKYEKTRVLGLRANQLNNGAQPFIEVDENIIDGYKIAELELKEKKIPFIIQRPLPGGNCEFWKLEDLEQI